MRKLLTLTLLAVLAAGLGGCALFDDERESAAPPVGMPSNVPEKPRYETARHVLRALHEGGVECQLLRAGKGNSEVGSSLDCLSKMDGEKFENDIHVLNPEKVTRDEIGDSIAAGRASPYNATIVAAGNWYVRVREARFADRIAEVLGGVVLPPLGKTEEGA